MTTLISERFGGVGDTNVNVHMETTRGPVIDEYQTYIQLFDKYIQNTQEGQVPHDIYDLDIILALIDAQDNIGQGDINGTTTFSGTIPVAQNDPSGLASKGVFIASVDVNGDRLFAKDDGAGGLVFVDANGVEDPTPIGTINYTTGAVSVNWPTATAPADGEDVVFGQTGLPNELEVAILALLDLAVNGRTDKIDPNDPDSNDMQFYLTLDMMQNVNNVVETLRDAGANINVEGLLNELKSGTPFSSIDIKAFVNITSDNVRNWLDLALLSPVVTNAVGGAAKAGDLANRTLQSMIELEYVRTGNELLAGKLEDLEENLILTKDTLDTLKDLQDLHNQLAVHPEDLGNFNFNYLTGTPNFRPDLSTSDTGDYVSNYLEAAESYFEQEIRAFYTDSGKLYDPVATQSEGINQLFVNRATVVDTTFGSPYSTFASNLAIFAQGLKSDLDVQLFGTDLQEAFLSISSGGVTNFVQQLINRIDNELGSENAGIVALHARDVLLPVIANALYPSGAEAVNTVLVNEITKYYNTLLEKKETLSRATVTNPADADPNTLRGRLSVILGDLGKIVNETDQNTQRTLAFTWLADGLEGGGTPLSDSGKFQQNITFGISAGQSLNDRQKEEVRRFLFVFEEYYKSASSMLQKITQIIEKIAQGIARS